MFKKPNLPSIECFLLGVGAEVDDSLLFLSSGFGFLGLSSSSKLMTKPFEASASSFNLSVFIVVKVSTSSSVRSENVYNVSFNYICIKNMAFRV